MISLHAVDKTFDGEHYVVKELELHVAEGEFVVLLGESGCGKTTTLKMINRLVNPTRGTIEVDGQDITHTDPVLLRRRIGYVFQGVGLFPHYTVEQNIRVVPKLLNWSPSDQAKRVEELLSLVGLEPGLYRNRAPHELSGGQRQRVGVARALAGRPKIVLMDEPFGAIDPITRTTLQKEYLNIHRELGVTTVMVTHDMTEACLLADRIAVLDRGRIVQAGHPSSLLVAPATPTVERLIATPLDQMRAIETLLSQSPGADTVE